MAYETDRQSDRATIDIPIAEILRLSRADPALINDAEAAAREAPGRVEASVAGCHRDNRRLVPADTIVSDNPEPL